MSGFLDVLVRVGSEPMSWIVLGVLAAWAAGSAFKFYICPLAAGRLKTMDRAAATRELNRRVRHSLTYLFVMLLAMGLAVAGLFGLAETEHKGTLAFFSLALGLFVILTLPVRMQIKEAETRVMAAPDDQGRALMAIGLRQTHWTLLQYEFGILALLTLIVVTF